MDDCKKCDSDSLIIYPGDPEFDMWMYSALPPDWKAYADTINQQCFFVAASDSGLLRPASRQELDEYLYGGEYDDRLEEIGDDDEEINELDCFANEEYFSPVIST
jgi:hypothetical protein